jgi:hypothetical protein
VSNKGAIVFAAVVAIAGLTYIFVRFTAAPAKIVVVNGSGRQVASVIVISDAQRVDIGAIGNGESRKVDLAPGKSLQIEYTFDGRHVWTSPEPLVALQALTIFIGADEKLRVIRGAPVRNRLQSRSSEEIAR